MAPKTGDINSNEEDTDNQIAAIHFGAFLQLNGHLLSTNSSWGRITKEKLMDVFTHQYQPAYHSCLQSSNLVSTLRKYGVAKEKKRQEIPPGIRIVKLDNPNEVQTPTDKRFEKASPKLSPVYNETHCKLCSVEFSTENNKAQHIQSDLHKLRLLYREEGCKQKKGVVVEIVGDSGNHVYLNADETHTVSVRVDPKAPFNKIEIFEIVQIDGIKSSPSVFVKNELIDISVTVVFHKTGAFTYPLGIKIMPSMIYLVQDLIFHVGSELLNQLKPKSPYIKQKSKILDDMTGTTVSGERIKKPRSRLETKEALPLYKVPKVYYKLVHKLNKFDDLDQSDKVYMENILKLLCGKVTYKKALQQVALTRTPFTETLTEDNYTRRYHLLIDFEELQLQWQLKAYSVESTLLKKCSTKYRLKMPDLSEGRPSVALGDEVYVKFNQESKLCRRGNESVLFEGIIHEIGEQHLLLGFHPSFSDDHKALLALGVAPDVRVQFLINRYPIRLMHRALNLLEQHKALPIVFPKKNRGSVTPTITATLSPWVNPVICNNPEQQRAILNIVRSNNQDPAPYIIYGPPGTGKTVTLVEAVVQVWHATHTKGVKQLVCAPSNEACNILAKRILRMLPSDARIFRLYATSIHTINIPDDLLRYCNYDKASHEIYFPSLKELLENHIIIVTLVSAGRLVTGGASNKFNYIYIDECGQATEPEALIAIAGLLTSSKCTFKGQLVLAGDPQQLGPVISSQVSIDFGLGVSFLERLMNENSIYKKNSDGYNARYITKLVQNFRSHETILRVPNELFYDNELQIKGDVNTINKAIGWKELPNKNIPIIFHGVEGLDQREAGSPSYFNPEEIDEVVKYIKKLLSDGLPNNYKVKEEDIGVITPYRKQVRKFQKAFDFLKLKIDVGSVEWFQGSEKLIILISTVRSRMALVEEDYRFNLGFLKNAKRFNVSLTRAKALLIIVGNPKILRHDKQWYQLLKFCKSNGAVKGTNFPLEGPLDIEMTQ